MTLEDFKFNPNKNKKINKGRVYLAPCSESLDRTIDPKSKLV
jgi:hypothetical protein